MDIERVAEYIREHLHEDLSLKAIARQFHYSESYLSREFKKQMGYSIKQYIESLKLADGIKSIVQSEDTVTNTSLKLGYSSLGSFSNAFKQLTGITPKQYHRKSTLAFKIIRNFIGKRETIPYHHYRVTTGNSLTVKVVYPEDYQPMITCVGLFRTGIPKEYPIVGVALVHQQQYTFENVPNGEYYLLACEIMQDMTFIKSYVLDYNFRSRLEVPLYFEGETHHQAKLMMRPPIASDPPIIINLPFLIFNNLPQKRN
ncbi:AraC family transcriptional regulator [Aerococcaceae bacterium NML180378]|nr:AraC family transcriptional regulator [Aerococcaceae bacterium NML180378]